MGMKQDNNLDQEGASMQKPYLISLHKKYNLSINTDLREPCTRDDSITSLDRQHSGKKPTEMQPRPNPIIPSPCDQGTLLNHQQSVQEAMRDTFMNKSCQYIRSEEGNYVVYIQSESSGRFVKRTVCLTEVNTTSDVNQISTVQMNDLNDYLDDPNQHVAQPYYNLLHAAIGPVLRLVQGLIAGFSVALLYEIFTTNYNNFAIAHSQSANETGRFQFIAISFCFVGSMVELCSSRCPIVFSSSSIKGGVGAPGLPGGLVAHGGPYGPGGPNGHGGPPCVGGPGGPSVPGVGQNKKKCSAFLYFSSLCIVVFTKHMEAKFIFSFGIEELSDENEESNDWVHLANEDGSVESAVATLWRLYVAQFIACILGWLFVLQT